MASKIMAAARKVYNANKKADEKTAFEMAANKWAEMRAEEGADIEEVIVGTDRYGDLEALIIYRWEEDEWLTYEDGEYSCDRLFMDVNRYGTHYVNSDPRPRRYQK